MCDINIKSGRRAARAVKACKSLDYRCYSKHFGVIKRLACWMDNVSQKLQYTKWSLAERIGRLLCASIGQIQVENVLKWMMAQTGWTQNFLLLTRKCEQKPGQNKESLRVLHTSLNSANIRYDFLTKCLVDCHQRIERNICYEVRKLTFE